MKPTQRSLSCSQYKNAYTNVSLCANINGGIALRITLSGTLDNYCRLNTGQYTKKTERDIRVNGVCGSDGASILNAR